MNSFLENRTALGRTDSSPLVAPKIESGFQPLFAPSQLQKPGSQPAANPENQSGETSKIELIQTAGRVDRIIVTCSCCNRIELQCQY